MNNHHRYFGSAAKAASCIIEHDYDEEELCNADERICFYFDSGMGAELIGCFMGSWEFEEWLCSDLTFEEWQVVNRSQHAGS